MHHALFVSCSYPTHADVERYFAELSLEMNGDTLTHLTDVLKIDDARYLSDQACLLPRESSVRTIVIGFQTATREAQNALLKTFEDPIATTRFIVFAPNIKTLLPTLASRLSLVDFVYSNKKDSSNPAGLEFLSLSLPERLKYVAGIASKEEGLSLISSLIHELEGNSHTHAEALRALENGARFLASPSASLKMILENISLQVPQR